MASLELLGNLIDISIGAVPTEVIGAPGFTGKRVHLKNYTGVTVVLIASAGSTDIMDVDFQQHTVVSGGSAADLDVIDHYYLKDETTLDGDETWTKVTQTKASEVTDIGTASAQQIAVFEISADSLADGYEWFSVDMPDPGSNGTKYVACIYILHGLRNPRTPANIPNPQA